MSRQTNSPDVEVRKNIIKTSYDKDLIQFEITVDDNMCGSIKCIPETAAKVIYSKLQEFFKEGGNNGQV